MTPTQHTHAFLTAYLDYAMGGPNPMDFRDDYGLCVNTIRYLSAIHGDMGGWEKEISNMHFAMIKVFDAEFTSRGLPVDYPFGRQEYVDRYNAKTQHQCPRRLAFVRNVLGLS